MKSPQRVVLVACLLLGKMPLAQAEEISASISQIYQSALPLSPEVLAQTQRITASNAARNYADRLTAAPLSLEGAYRSDRNFDNQGLREVDLGISAPLWLWNERDKTRQLRQAELEASDLRLNSLKLDLAGQIRRVYWDAISARLDVEIAQARVADSERLMVDIRHRFEAGDVAKTDLLQAIALHAQVNSEHGRASSALQTVGAEFTEITGLPVSVLGKHEREANPVDSQLHVEVHPAYQLLQSEAMREQSRAGLIAIQKRDNPEVGLTIVNERGEFTAPNEKSLIVSTRIPLGSSAEHESRLLAALADETETRERLKRLGTTLKAQASAAQANVEWFEKLNSNSQEQAELAQQVYALYQQSFALGETDLPTLLRFEQQAFEAERLARKSAIEFAIRVSAYRQALGLLPE